jgi:hypothetical protein
MSDPIKAPRADAKLKRLADEVQEQLHRYVNQPGVTQMDGIAWLEREHSVKTSAGAFSEWLSWFSARQRAREREQRVNVLLSEERQIHPELSDEDLFSRGQRLMTLLTIGEEDPKNWATVQKVALDRQGLALDRQKFQRETCELFVKWCENERAKEIANSSATNAEKIEQLGELMFGESWKS